MSPCRPTSSPHIWLTTGAADHSPIPGSRGKVRPVASQDTAHLQSPSLGVGGNGDTQAPPHGKLLLKLQHLRELPQQHGRDHTADRLAEKPLRPDSISKRWARFSANDFINDCTSLGVSKCELRAPEQTDQVQHSPLPRRGREGSRSDTKLPHAETVVWMALRTPQDCAQTGSSHTLKPSRWLSLLNIYHRPPRASDWPLLDSLVTATGRESEAGTGSWGACQAPAAHPTPGDTGQRGPQEEVKERQQDTAPRATQTKRDLSQVCRGPRTALGSLRPKQDRRPGTRQVQPQL